MRDRVKVGVAAVVLSLRRPRWSHPLEERAIRLSARRVLLAMLVWLFSVIPAASAFAQDNTPLPEAPPYKLPRGTGPTLLSRPAVRPMASAATRRRGGRGPRAPVWPRTGCG
jgi:hypothetical protein